MSFPRPPLPPRWQQYWEGLSYGQQRRLQALVVLALLALAAWPASLALRPTINHWRHRRALALAAKFEQQQDYRNLVLALHRATQIAPDDLATWRWVARTLDSLGASDALVAHENVVALAPGDSQARAALAAAALRLGSPAAARAALDQLAQDPAQRESYLRLAAEFARAADDFPRYARHLAELARLEPDDADVHFNLAVLQLGQLSPATQDAGRDALIALLKIPGVRVRASLALLRHAARRRDASLAAAVMHAIIDGAGNRSNSAAPADTWPALLTTLQTSAAASGDADVARLAEWMGTVRLTREAVAWLDTLPEATRSAAAVRDITAELAARLGDLDRVRLLLARGAWGNFPPECIDSALAARANQLAQHTGAALSHWQEALRFAEQSPAALRAIARLARLWQDDGTVELAAKAALRLRPPAPWANRELRDIYFARGDTAKLLAHYRAWLVTAPDRPSVLFGCVRTAVAHHALDAALEQEIASRTPADPPSPLATLARVLALSPTQPEAARQLLSTLPAAARDLPEAVLVRALVDHDPAAVRVMTQRSQELLPEERIFLKSLEEQVDK